MRVAGNKKPRRLASCGVRAANAEFGGAASLELWRIGHVSKGCRHFGFEMYPHKYPRSDDAASDTGTISDPLGAEDRRSRQAAHVDNFSVRQCLNIEQIARRSERLYLWVSPEKRTKIVHTSAN